jgi:hypothetical protein
VQFLAIGAALVALQRVAHTPAASAALSEQDEVRVPATVLARFREEHVRNVHRAPTPAEEADAVLAYVDDEVMFRQARALKLDEGDAIVRRRLIQKAEFILDDLEPVPAPNDADLQRYLDEHREAFLRPSVASFVHVLVARDRHGARTEDDAAALAAKIRARGQGAPLPVEASDPFLSGTSFVKRSERDLDGVFGPGFGKEVLALPVGVVSGPIRSSYGLHLVQVTESAPAFLPSLDELRPKLAEAWARDARARTRAEAHERLRASIRVRIESSPAAPQRGEP